MTAANSLDFSSACIDALDQFQERRLKDHRLGTRCGPVTVRRKRLDYLIAWLPPRIDDRQIGGTTDLYLNHLLLYAPSADFQLRIDCQEDTEQHCSQAAAAAGSVHDMLKGLGGGACWFPSLSCCALIIGRALARHMPGPA